jgi:hypothetical protein
LARGCRALHRPLPNRTTSGVASPGTTPKRCSQTKRLLRPPVVRARHKGPSLQLIRRLSPQIIAVPQAVGCCLTTAKQRPSDASLQRRVRRASSATPHAGRSSSPACRRYFSVRSRRVSAVSPCSEQFQDHGHPTFYTLPAVCSASKTRRELLESLAALADMELQIQSLPTHC